MHFLGFDIFYSERFFLKLRISPKVQCQRKRKNFKNGGKNAKNQEGKVA